MTHTVTHNEARIRSILPISFSSRHILFSLPHSIIGIKQVQFSRIEIRKSLHTSNRIEATKMARRMWLTEIDMQIHSSEVTIVPGIPKDKFDLILSIPEALQGIRKNIGLHGDDIKITWIHNYISKIGDDPDALTELMHHLSIEEKESLSDMPAFKRALLILRLKTNQHVNIPTSFATDAHSRSHETQPTTPICTSKNKAKSTKVSDLVEIYLREYKTDYRRNKNIDPPQNSINENQRALTTFSAILGDTKISLVTKEKIKFYINKSYTLPARLNKISGLTHISTNEEILLHHMDKIDQIPEGQYPRKSNGTLKKEFGIVKQFLKWLHREDHLDRDFSVIIRGVSVSSSKVK